MKFVIPVRIRYTYSMLIAELTKELSESEEYWNILLFSLFLTTLFPPLIPD